MPKQTQIPVSPQRLEAYATGLLASVMIGNRRMAVFAGAGLSAAYGGPSWGEVTTYILADAVIEIEGYASDAKNLSHVESTRLRRSILQLRELLRAIAASERPGNDEMVIAQTAVDDAFRDLPPTSHQDSDSPSAVHRLLGDLFGEPSGVLIWRAVQYHFADNVKRQIDDQWIHLARIQRDWRSRIKAAQLRHEQNGEIAMNPFDRAPSTRSVLEEIFRDPSIKQSGIKAFSLRDIPIGFLPEKAPSERFGTELIVAAIERLMSPSSIAREGLARPPIDPLRTLEEKFGVSRFLTLNYDWEIERQALQLGRDPEPIRRSSPWSRNDTEVDFSRSTRLRRGRIGISDAYHPSNISNLFEFALTSPEVSRHVVHLHGRIDTSDWLIATAQDYSVQPRFSISPTFLMETIRLSD